MFMKTKISNKFDFIILIMICVIIFSIPVYLQVTEIKRTTYSGKVIIPKVDLDHKIFFIDFLKSSDLKYNKDAEITCNTSYGESLNGFSDINFESQIDEFKIDKIDVKKALSSQCTKIIVDTIETYIEFYDIVIGHYKSSLNPNNQNYYSSKIQELTTKKFFLSITSQKFKNGGVTLNVKYKPSTLTDHLINYLFVGLILIALIAGYFVTKKKFSIID